MLYMCLVYAINEMTCKVFLSNRGRGIVIKYHKVIGAIAGKSVLRSVAVRISQTVVCL